MNMDLYYNDIATFYATMDALSDNLSDVAKRRITFRFAEEIRRALDRDTSVSREDADIIINYIVAAEKSRINQSYGISRINQSYGKKEDENGI